MNDVLWKKEETRLVSDELNCSYLHPIAHFDSFDRSRTHVRP